MLNEKGLALIDYYSRSYKEHKKLAQKFKKTEKEKYEFYTSCMKSCRFFADHVRSSKVFRMDHQIKVIGSKHNANIKESETALLQLGFISDGFNRKDDSNRVELSSAVILLQYLSGTKINGNVQEEELIYFLNHLKKNEIFADTILAFVNEFWKPEKSLYGVNRYSIINGQLPMEDLVQIPCCGYGMAYGERNSSIAWAMMVQGGMRYNKELEEKAKKLNLKHFLVTGQDSAYRSYHYQVEARFAWKVKGNENNASPIIFATQEGQKEFEALANRTKIADLNGWNNISRQLTQKGAILDGRGTSNHGIGCALDLNFQLEQYTLKGQNGSSGEKERYWVEKNGAFYGFKGMYSDGATTYKETIQKNGKRVGNYKESWHLTFDPE